MFSVVFMDAYCDERPGIRVTYRTDSQIFNQRRMHFQSCVYATSIHAFLFADDYALNADSERDMQRSMDLYAATCGNFGLVVNMESTVVMHQPPPHATYVAHQINLNGAQLQAVDNFTYLGSFLSQNKNRR
nr:unnamed protein product [Spirometra erinaceieuropaei]